MKKYLAGAAIGVFVGHTATSYAWLKMTGGWDRMLELLKRDTPDEISFVDWGEYVMRGTGPLAPPTQSMEEWVQEATKKFLVNIQRAQAMAQEGYSAKEIADTLGVPESSIHEVFKTMDES